MVAFLRRTQMDAAFSPRMLKGRYARDIFRLSAPNSVQQASGTIITTVKQGLLGGLGVEAIAGFSCAGKLSSLLMMPVFGFVQSTVFFIAQNTAALQPGRVKEGLGWWRSASACGDRCSGSLPPTRQRPATAAPCWPLSR